MKQFIDNIIKDTRIPIRLFFISLLIPFSSFVLMTFFNNDIIRGILGVIFLTAPIICLIGLLIGIIQIIKFKDYYEYRSTIVKGLIGNLLLLIVHIIFLIIIFYIGPMV